VLAQDPTTAVAGSMPAAAILTGCVDFMLPLNALADALVTLVMAPGAESFFRVLGGATLSGALAPTAR
jgi:two-component system chemotaxis response regulator CheB